MAGASGTSSAALRALIEAARRNHRGKALWRSLDELADTAAFREWVANEFPPGVVDGISGVSRRQVLKLMGASFALAGLTGCSKQPPEDIVPAVRPGAGASGVVPGRPTYFATAVVRNGYAQGVLGESHMGRPTKLEGNPDHPASLGGTDVFGQAEILNLYDPDRSQTVFEQGQFSTWDHFRSALSERISRLRERGGQGLRLLTGHLTSPTLVDQISAVLRELPEAKWHAYEPIDDENLRRGTELAFGKPAEMVYRFDRADVILSLDCDFLFALPGSVRYARDFADRRRVREGFSADAMNRLYVAEPTPTVTGAAADHRWPVRASGIAEIVRALADELGVWAQGEAARSSSDRGGSVAAWVKSVARDLQAHAGSSLVVAGRSQPAHVHALVCAINDRLGNVGQTVLAIDPVRESVGNQPLSLTSLAEDMAAREVDTLVMVGVNPAYDAPGALNFAERLKRVPFSVHMGLLRDETSQRCRWHLPMNHTLESWGDARAFDGTVSILQPLTSPLYEGRSALQLMAMLRGAWKRSDRQIVQDYWRARIGADGFPFWWKRVLRDGVAVESASRPKEVALRAEAVRDALAAAAEDRPPGMSSQPGAAEPHGAAAEADAGVAEGGGWAEQLELCLRPDAGVWDGRFANNGWLQELPRPVTKLVWDNAALIAPATASALGVTNGQVVELTTLSAGGGDGKVRAVRAPVWVTPGQAAGVVSLSLGYGRRAAGGVGTGVGVDAYRLRGGEGAWFAPVRVEVTGARHDLVSTQHHHLMEDRDLYRTGTIAAFAQDPKGIAHEHDGKIALSLYPDRLEGSPQWGMVIDLSTCIGCNACTIACQAENNIPVVGKEQVAIGREMHWIRIDRYFEGEVAEPRIYQQPVPCMHCENAPCEVVCPVSATSHSDDGLNEMTYNRCVGTRYCSNNCPYKVRRFNFLRYTDPETASLKLMRNPDVTVRGRGVMEKCTYCVQRIRGAQIDARKENRAIADGEVVTACQQACPTQAITFGNIADATSKVSAARNQPHEYGLLTELNTRPRTTYLAAVRNPNPELEW